jgi:outer membrane protein OmpA-like peptidoglycan-associated protein
MEVAYSVPFVGCAAGNKGRLDPNNANRVLATDLTWIALAVREGRLNISDVQIVRLIDLGGQKDDGSLTYAVDTAVFDGFLDTTTANGSTPIPFVLQGNGDYVMNGNEYKITIRATDKAVIVDDLNVVDEGLDILIGIEKLVFSGNGAANAGGFNSAAGVRTTLDLRTAAGLPANYLISGGIQSGEPVHEVFQTVNCTGTATPVLSGGRVVIPTIPTGRTAPVVAVAASASGDRPVVGDVLIGSASFTGTPAPVVSYQWYSCTTSGASSLTLPSDCSAIVGANTNTYRSASFEENKFVRFSATGTNSEGSITSYSATGLAAIAPVTPTPTTPPAGGGGGGGSTPAPAPAPAAASTPTATTVAPAAPIALPSRGNASNSKSNKSIYFANASSKLSSDAKKNLDKLAAELKRGSTVAIAGFTTGNQSSSLKLADTRAKVVANYLKSKGFKATIKKSTGGIVVGSLPLSRRVDIEVQSN